MAKKPQIISAIQDKGGSGKTTLLCVLAAAHSEDGARVAIVDADPLKAAGDYATQTERRDPEERGNVVVDYIHELDHTKLAGTVRGLGKSGYDLILIDTAGVDSKTKDYAIQLSDLVLIPVKPSRADLKGMKRSVDTVQGVEDLSGRKIPFFTVLVDIDLRTRITKAVTAALDEGGLPRLDKCLLHRTGFKEFISNGGALKGAARAVASEVIGEMQGRGLLSYYKKPGKRRAA